MRIPQTAERLKEVPAQALRAVLSKEAPAQQALRAALSKEAPAQALRAVLSREAPAQALRAVFSGVGQVLLVTERVRRRAMGGDREAAAPAAPRTETGPAARTAPAKASSAKASTAKTSTAKTSTAKAGTAKAGTAKAPTAKASTAKASTAKAPTAKTSTAKASAAKSVSAPPIPNYPRLSVASLRARMRGLDTAQLQELIGYERAHEGRETVIAMFERRIAKLESEGPAAG